MIEKGWKTWSQSGLLPKRSRAVEAELGRSLGFDRKREIFLLVKANACALKPAGRRRITDYMEGVGKTWMWTRSPPEAKRNRSDSGTGLEQYRSSYHEFCICRRSPYETARTFTRSCVDEKGERSDKEPVKARVKVKHDAFE